MQAQQYEDLGEASFPCHASKLFCIVQLPGDPLAKRMVKALKMTETTPAVVLTRAPVRRTQTNTSRDSTVCKDEPTKSSNAQFSPNKGPPCPQVDSLTDFGCKAPLSPKSQKKLHVHEQIEKGTALWSQGLQKQHLTLF